MIHHHPAFIHEKAHVDISCEIGAGTRIHHFASVTRGARLGEDCVVWPFAMLDGSQFGDRCSIASGVAMGPGFKIGNDCFIGPNVVFCNDMWPEVDKTGYDDAKLRSFEHFVITVGNRTSIGANAVILPGVRIGSDCVIGAGSVIRSNVLSGCVVYPGVADDEFDGLREMRMDPIEARRARRMRWAR